MSPGVQPRADLLPGAEKWPWRRYSDLLAILSARAAQPSPVISPSKRHRHLTHVGPWIVLLAAGVGPCFAVGEWMASG